MSNINYTVMVAGVVPDDMQEYVKNYLKTMMDHSRDDAGCIAYNVHQSLSDPNEFMMYSVWTDREAFEKHNQKPEMQEFKKKLAQSMFQELSPKTYWTLID